MCFNIFDAARIEGVPTYVFFCYGRVAGLETANGRIRDRAKMLLEKSDADDRLVDALRNEIQVGEWWKIRDQ